MTTRLQDRLKIAGAGLIAAGVVWFGAHTMYLRPRAALDSQIEAMTSEVDGLKQRLGERRDVDARASQIFQRTLSAKEDALSARFRDGLARVCEMNGLTGVVVDHAKPQADSSPLLDVRGLQSDLKKKLRAEPDFFVVRGTAKGSGTLEQVIATIAAAQIQPWIHRVDGFTIRPIGKERERYELTLNVATIFAPGFAPRKKGVVEEPEPTIVAIPTDLLEITRRVASRDPFRRAKPDMTAPPPVVVAGPATDGQPSPPPAAPFAPYEEWRLAGLAAGRSGPEALFVNVKSGAKKTLQRGGSLLDAVFVEGAGEKAFLEIGGKRFELNLGETLAARRPLG